MNSLTPKAYINNKLQVDIKHETCDVKAFRFGSDWCEKKFTFTLLIQKNSGGGR